MAEECDNNCSEENGDCYTDPCPFCSSFSTKEVFDDSKRYLHAVCQDCGCIFYEAEVD